MSREDSLMIHKHVVVVHGIGDQKPNETVIGFMNEFVRSLPDHIRDTVHVHNLLETVGAGTATPSASSRALTSGHPAYLILEDRGQKVLLSFSEVYWQPITNAYLAVNEGIPPIPIFTWAHSINTRMFHGGASFHIAREAIDNLEILLRLLRNLAVIYKKSGDFADITSKFLGDVEMYVESDEIRGKIDAEFIRVLARVHLFFAEPGAHHKVRRDMRLQDDWPGLSDPEIYIVAHSEGTVISYASLVQAASEREKNPSRHAWLPRVSGLVTMGSPLDKHYSIWDTRFPLDILQHDTGLRIPWFNYWDRSDPVAYGLKTLKPNDPQRTTDASKLFAVKFDKGFIRYSLPGKAHIDYWHDKAVYTDIVQAVMGLGGTHQPKAASQWWGKDWLLWIGDRLGYAAVRVVTLGALIFFLNGLLRPVRRFSGWAGNLLSLLPHLSLEVPRFWIYSFWVFAPLLLAKWLGDFNAEREDPLLRFIRNAILAAWQIIVLSICFSVTRFDKPTFEIKDSVGYLSGLAVSFLAWRLHTTIHKGLVQMWRYTGGKGTAVETS